MICQFQDLPQLLMWPWVKAGDAGQPAQPVPPATCTLKTALPDPGDRDLTCNSNLPSGSFLITVMDFRKRRIRTKRATRTRRRARKARRIPEAEPSCGGRFGRMPKMGVFGRKESEPFDLLEGLLSGNPSLTPSHSQLREPSTQRKKTCWPTT